MSFIYATLATVALFLNEEQSKTAGGDDRERVGIPAIVEQIINTVDSVIL